MDSMIYEGLTFIFDVDGTLCPIKKPEEDYKDLIPHPDMIRKMKQYKAQGAKIILFTSRNMKTYHENLGLINKYTAQVMREWLEKWDIPYDEILFGKPWPGKKGFYVDDRSIRPDEFLKLSIDELDSVCKESRLENHL